jgi:hypothetical protein
VHYVDGTAKGSLPRVTEALDRTVGGSITRCPGVRLSVRPSLLRFGTPVEARRGLFSARIRCNLDCAYVARVERASTHSTKLMKRGRLEVGELGRIDLGRRKLGPGTYRYTLSLVHPVNPGQPTRLRSRPFTLP